VPPSDPLPASVVHAELNRILASEIFARSERLSAFLKFIVERTLAGEGDTLKEQVIAFEVYGKGRDFTTAADPIVRVDARRLRDRLREYYAARGPGEVVISVPKGSYTPAFTRATVVATAGGESVPAPVAPARDTRWWIAGMVAIAIVVAGAWLANNRMALGRSDPVRLLTVTSWPSAEEDPALSPDGNFVAFSWSNTGAAGDVWIKAVDGDATRRLTDTPDVLEKYATWSPDSQQIAFTRLANGTSSVWLISALGGPARMIAPGGSYSSWLPDGRSLVIVSQSPVSRAGTSLVQYSLDNGATRTLTEAPPGFRESHPKVSPDGRMVVFNRSGGGRSAVFLKQLAGGEPTQIVDWASGVLGGLTWTPDGRDIIYPRPEQSGRRLVRFTIGSRDPPVPIDGAPPESVSPSTSRRAGGGFRLAFSSGQPDVGLQLIDLRAPGHGGTIGAGTEFCDATRMDVPGRFSPDGSHVAFVTDRTGMQQVWIAGRDQSDCRSLTNLPHATVNLGSWSPDGQSIAFDATVAGNTNIYVVSVNGGPLTQLTDGSAIELDPEWSHDGRWIYFSSNESGRSEIWKMSATGGTRLKLTTSGGFDPRESQDGRFVYFVTLTRWYGLGPGTRLQRVSTQGGATSMVPVDVMPGAWGLAGDSVMYLVARAESLTSPDADIVAVYDIATERVHELGPLPFRVGPYGATRFFVVSPDGRWALASHVDSWNRDIFVLDNLR
jgi:Tol biopolymer transport system component